MTVATCRRCGTALEDTWRNCPGCGRPRGRGFHLPLRRQQWWRILIVGAVLYWATMKLLASSGNPNFAPTVILLGAFLIPVSYVTYLYEADALYDVPTPTLWLTFFYGGVLGTIAAQLLEQRLVLNMGLIGMLGVGFSEELAKPIGTLWLSRRQEFRSPRHGFVLGAAAGMGFAAFETMGYGFTFLVRGILDGQSQGGPTFGLDQLGQVLLTRGLLSPMAHAAWTALVVGVFWREGKRINRAVIGAFLTAVVLHALWNYTAGSIPIEVAVPGIGLRWRFVDLSIPAISLPVPGLIIGALGLWAVRRANRVPTPIATPTLR